MHEKGDKPRTVGKFNDPVGRHWIYSIMNDVFVLIDIRDDGYVDQPLSDGTVKIAVCHVDDLQINLLDLKNARKPHIESVPDGNFLRETT